jgi:hypothetical protein
MSAGFVTEFGTPLTRIEEIDSLFAALGEGEINGLNHPTPDGGETSVSETSNDRTGNVSNEAPGKKQNFNGPQHVDVVEENCETIRLDCDEKLDQQGLIDFAKKAHQANLNLQELSQAMDEFTKGLAKVRLFFTDQSSSDTVVDGIIRRFESLILFVYQISTANSTADILVDALAYLQTFIHGSIYGKVKNFVTLLLTQGKRLVQRPKHLEFQGSWLESNWTSLTKGDFGSRISSMLNLFVLLGVMPEKASSFITTEFYVAFNVQTKKNNTGSVLEHIVRTFDFVVDSVYPAVVNGDLSMLFSERDQVHLDDLYRKALNAADMYNSNQMERLKSQLAIGGEADLLSFMEHALLKHLEFKVHCESYAKKEINIRVIKLDRLITDLRATFRESDMRVEPYAILTYGITSQAKTILNTALSHAICKRNGFPEGPEYRVTLNAMDSYQSEYRSSHVVVHFDDIANTKAEHEKDNPLFKIIQFINNVHCTALSPEAEKKGKMDIRCKVVMGTTNKMDINASYFSNCPASILRRFNLILDVRLKKGVTDGNGRILPQFSKIPMPDLWNIKAYVVAIRDPDVSGMDWEFVQIRSIADITDLVDYLSEDTVRHYTLQEEIVATAKDLHKSEHCEHHPLFTMPCCKCARDGPPVVEEKLDKQGWWGSQESVQSDDSSDSDGAIYLDPSETLQVYKEFYGVETVEEEVPPVQVDSEPPPEQKKPSIRKYFEKKKQKVSDSAKNFSAFADRTPAYQEELRPMLRRQIGEEGFTWEEVYSELEHCSVPQERISKIVRMKNFRLKDIFLRSRDQMARVDPRFKALLAFSAMLGFSLVSFKMYKKFENQGANISQLEARAMTPKMVADHDDKYKRPIKLGITPSKNSISIKYTDLEERIDKNLRGAIIYEIDENTRENLGPPCFCNVSPVGEGDWLFPAHLLDLKKCYKVLLLTHPQHFLGVKHICAMVNSANMAPFEARDDLMLVALCSGSNWAMDKYFPLDHVLKVGDPIRIYHRSYDSVVNENHPSPSDSYVATTILKIADQSVGDLGKVPRITYNYPGTFQGLCGALVVTNDRNPCVIGVHTAGKDNIGACTPLTKEKVDSVRSQMRGPDVVRLAEESPIPQTMQGAPVPLAPFLHGRNALNWLPAEDVHSAEIFGTTGLPNARFKTNVEESCIAPALKEHLGIEKEHAGPLRSAVSAARYKDTKAVTTQLPPVNPRILEYAKQDVLQKLEKAVTPEMCEFIHKLSVDHAVNGVPGVKGFDPINIKTSVGVPLNVSKEKLLAEVDIILQKKFGISSKKNLKVVELPDGSTELSFHIEFDPKLYPLDDILEETIEVMVDGKRVNFVFRVNLKDEALPMEKVAAGKIRAFAGAQLSLVIICRCLTLPTVNMMKSFPTVFESAVGVDATGKDWEFLHDYIDTFENKGQGDFSQYDKTTSSSVSKASAEILRYLLRRGGATEEDLRLFDSMITDIIFPIYDMDGVLVGVDHSLPSGHPLTVILNGINNMLLMRYVYYANHAPNFPDGIVVGKSIPLFHFVVKLITYGDDNLWSVSDEEKLFNMISIMEQLRKIGMKYTSASKGDIESRFIRKEDMTFLKRGFVRHAVLDAVVAPLEIASIHKSLTCTRKEKGRRESDAQIMAMNMGSALRELFLHGEDVYQHYFEGFQKVAEETVDREGFRVRDFYDPPSIQDCIESFQSTTCRYAECLEKYNVKLEFQAQNLHGGQLTWEDAEEIRHFEQLNDWDMMTFRSIGDLELFYDFADHVAMRDQILNEMERAMNNRARQHRQVARCARQIEALFHVAYDRIRYPQLSHYDRVRGFQTFAQNHLVVQLFERSIARSQLLSLEFIPDDIKGLIVEFSATEVFVVSGLTATVPPRPVLIGIVHNPSRNFTAETLAAYARVGQLRII